MKKKKNMPLSIIIITEGANGFTINARLLTTKYGLFGSNRNETKLLRPNFNGLINCAYMMVSIFR